MGEDKKDNFKVTDKRVLQEENEKGDYSSEKVKDKTPPLKLDFFTFVTSLHTSALIHFGIIPDPISKQSKTNLDLAKQNIDILEILDEKTKGNLSLDEQNLIKDALYDLRMKFVELSKKKG